MYKILTAVAVVALATLGTTIIATVLLHSSISKQSSQIKSLQGAERSDHQKIAALEGEVGAGTKHTKLTAASPRCPQLRQPIASPGAATATPRLLLTIRRDRLTNWIALTEIRVTSDVTAPGHCR